MSAKRIAAMTDLDDSQICYWKDEAGLWVYLPGCGVGLLSNHSVQEHENGTISVTPSIVIRGHKAGSPTERHGYLTNGEWKEC